MIFPMRTLTESLNKQFGSSCSTYQMAKLWKTKLYDYTILVKLSRIKKNMEMKML
jgi:hypothetical protein